jgi:dihydrolipoamide dehydrogenase
VTVIEFLPRIVPMADLEVGTLLFRSLMKQGLEFQLETKVTGAKVAGDRVTVAAETKDGKTLSIECDRVLVAVGRRPYTEGLGLAEAGVNVDPKSGKVPIDGRFRTNVATISAIGDLVDGPMLAHKAEDEGIAFAEILAGKAGHVDYNTVPSVIYTWPEMASVGITEEQAKERKLDYRVGKFPFLPNGRAKAMDETEGLVKILADATTDRVLGVHIVGPRASDLIAEAVTTMEFGGSAEDIARICHAHPTLSEVVREAALAVDRRAIHG